MALSKVEGLTVLSKAEGPFDKPFDKLTVLSKVEGLMALNKAERLRCASSPPC